MEIFFNATSHHSALQMDAALICVRGNIRSDYKTVLPLQDTSTENVITIDFYLAAVLKVPNCLRLKDSPHYESKEVCPTSKYLKFTHHFICLYGSWSNYRV